jgi:hypothetical protein
MPSLIYIARISRFSEQIMENLRSYGFHVRSFGAGEITADECLLVMTSDALLSSLDPANAASAAAKEPGAGGIRPVSEVNSELGSQATIWQIINTAAAKKSEANYAEKPIVAPTSESNNKDLGFIPNEHGRRTLKQRKSVEPSPSLPMVQPKSSVALGNPIVSSLPLSSDERLRVKLVRTSVTSPAKTLRRIDKIRSVFGWVMRVFCSPSWRPVAAAVSLLFVAVVLLTHRASTLPLTTGEITGDTDQSTVAPESKEITRPASSEKPSPVPRQRHSDYDFVAEDFTNHLATQSHEKPYVQSPDLKRNAQGSPNRKRIVVN